MNRSTRRATCKGPNLQRLPIGKSIPKPPVLVEVDFAEMEQRIIAYYGKEIKDEKDQEKSRIC